MASTSVSTHLHVPSHSARPSKPALKLTPLFTPHIHLPPMDLTALVAASIRACPSPRRNQPEFRLSGGADPSPAPPPPTPVDEHFHSLHTPSSSASTPRSEKRVHFEGWPHHGSEDSPRSSGEKERE